ncbi:ABC transporter ATP-binding protein [Flavobacterium cellulosilyticum]|uniref:ABC transporter ATP-binding protein n=1 Tax=Flavobacterium cellulosilyticum TaxID=2541731 RepID=UPI001FE536F2|nr:ABC transporter ATP-binding protein [Flavobacterium cellulosilyticum]
MKDIILKAENISKQYRLGQVGTGTLSHDLNRWWHEIRGKENPYLKIGDTNDRSTKGESDYVWALQGINFEVERGEVLGIIGKNGAGKSTLLKILSRVTAPTTGNIKFGGRVASLLEVGTGFNGEMTGRENIYLNGAILGMTKKEIASKLDEIIEFSGCERYIDTPVKRYSSGMTVRLAFAVAAFLEPEILIIDEVLAVGDAEFQKKAIGKMQDISKKGGRTVLFVSHNMAAVKQLCSKAIVLEYGAVVFEGRTDDAIENYFQEVQLVKHGKRIEIINDSLGFFTKWYIKDNDSFIISSDQKENICFEFDSNGSMKNCELGLVIRNFEGKILFGCNSRDFEGDYFDVKKGKYIFNIQLVLPIIDGKYEIDIALVSNNNIIDQWVSETNLIVKNKFESVLDRKWRGELNLKTFFSYDELY